MNEAKATQLFDALQERKVIGRDPEQEDGPPIESRFMFAVRLIAGTDDEGETRNWSVRVTGLHEASDWRDVFEAVNEADQTIYGKGQVWPRTSIRIQNNGIELT